MLYFERVGGGRFASASRALSRNQAYREDLAPDRLEQF